MNSFDLGYGTNGFANHRLDDALRVIADLGYTAVGLTLDHHHLDPFAPGRARAAERLAGLLSSLGLRCVVETGARYLLDPSRKHHPTLVSESAGPRIDFLLRSVRIAQILGAECVSFWSGVSEPGVSGQTNRDRLTNHLGPVVDEAQRRGVRLALEPEPGMVVERLDEALELRRALGEPEVLGVTLDVGHCVAVEPVDAATCVVRAGRLLFNVQLDDMLPGVHEHLEFGQGELDLAGTLAALDRIGYRGVAAVELPRHSHAAPQVAARALAALRRAREGTGPRQGGAPMPDGAPSVPSVPTVPTVSSTIGER
ncbi:sugar phosphate isomerase/epimerase family protein [Streptomyces sp. NPDC058659]|uniref:sugar phosphate isomerase/epimerase family protein n=1 Tax=unclassified Streptomyces TaxID=2593676 RepID=UPI00365D436C